MIKSKLNKIIIIIIAIVAPFVSCHSEDIVDHETSTAKLAVIPPSIIDSVAVSPDCKRIAYPYRIGNLWYIGGNVENTQPQAVDEIIPESIMFSANGNNIVYMAEVDDRYVLCANEYISQQFDEILKGTIEVGNYQTLSFKLITNGKKREAHWNFNKYVNEISIYNMKENDENTKDLYGNIFIKKDNKWVLQAKVYDDNSTYYDEITVLNSSIFKGSINDTESLFIVSRGKTEEELSFCEQIIPSVPKILCIGIDKGGPVGYDIAYTYIDNGKLVLKTGLVEPIYKDKNITKGYIEGKMLFSDGQFTGMRRGRMFKEFNSPIVDNQHIESSSGIERIVWGNRLKKRIAVVAKYNNKYAVLINKEKGQLYDEIGDIIFSPDDKHYAYSAKLGNDWLVVLDGKEGDKYKSVSDLVYNNESTFMTYMAQHNEKNSKYCASQYKPNDLWGVVVNNRHSDFAYANKYFSKVFFDKEDEFHLISGRYLTTTAQEKRQEYIIELKNYKIARLDVKKDEPAKLENKVQ
jgi:hypothetical protein